jgi:hypothetical protein
MQGGAGVLRFRLSDLQLDSPRETCFHHTRSMRCRLTRGSRGPAGIPADFEDGDRYQVFVHSSTTFAKLRPAVQPRAAVPTGLVVATTSICFQPPGLSQHVAYLGEEVFFLRRRERYRGILGGDAYDGAVESIESFLIDDGRNFAGEPSGA